MYGTNLIIDILHIFLTVSRIILYDKCVQNTVATIRIKEITKHMELHRKYSNSLLGYFAGKTSGMREMYGGKTSGNKWNSGGIT